MTDHSPDHAERAADKNSLQSQIELLTPLARVLDVYSDRPSRGDEFIAAALAEFIRITHLVARRAAIAMEPQA